MHNEMIHQKRTFSDVRQLIEWAAGEYGERVAYSYASAPGKKDSVKVEHSYIALRDDVRALASALIARGATGKHVVLIGKLSYEWVLCYYAVLSIGAVLVPMDRDWTAEDLAKTATSADVGLLIADADIAEKAALICREAGLDGYTTMGGGENSVSALVECGRERFLAEPDAYFNARIDPHAMSLLVFTSGTTGKGKGVMLSQDNFLSDLSDVIPYVAFRDKTLGVLPPHHTYGSSVLFIGHVMIGCEVYISAGLRYIQKEMREEKPGHLILVPLYLETFYRRIRATIKDSGKEALVSAMIAASNALRKLGIDVRKKMFAKIREAFGGEVSMIISGGAPINGEILAFFEAIGISTLNGYGITECAPIIAVNRTRHVVPGSVGTVLDIDHVKIDKPNEDGEGEILVTGPNVMLGYYKDEAATRDAIDGDGYFHTGDYGKLRKDRVLYITGRKKNLIILSNGKNAYPEEIESELVAVPGVLDVVVYEGQSRRGMEHNAIVAEIFPDEEFVKKNGIADLNAYFQPFVDEYNRRAVPYKKIGLLRVRTEPFPKNTLRKIMRFKLDVSID